MYYTTKTATVTLNKITKKYSGNIVKGRIQVDDSQFNKDFNLNPKKATNQVNKELSAEQMRQAIVGRAQKYVDKIPYRFGGGGTINYNDKIPSSSDCSAFSSSVYLAESESLGLKKNQLNIGRTTSEQQKIGTQINPSKDYNNLKKGDLIIFDTDNNGKPDHVGIFAGKVDGKSVFIHEQSSYGWKTIDEIGNKNIWAIKNDKDRVSYGNVNYNYLEEKYYKNGNWGSKILVVKRVIQDDGSIKIK